MKTFSLDQRAGLTHHKVHQKGHQLSWGGGVESRRGFKNAPSKMSCNCRCLVP